MVIKDLQVNQQVILQMIHNSEVYEVSTTVVGTVEGKALLSPFSYAGKTLDLGNKGFERVVFNLFLDSPEDLRVCFPNVKIKLINYKNAKYYSVTTSTSHPMAVISDRRNNKRMKVAIPATVTCDKLQQGFYSTIHDISDTGIAFTLQEQVELVNHSCVVEFEDTVKDEVFKLKIQARCIRRDKSPDGRYLYGCSVSDASHKMMTYVYILKILAMG